MGYTRSKQKSDYIICSSTHRNKRSNNSNDDHIQHSSGLQGYVVGHSQSVYSIPWGCLGCCLLQGGQCCSTLQVVNKQTASSPSFMQTLITHRCVAMNWK